MLTLCTADIEGVEGASYYAFSPHRDWRFIVLDSYDVSVLGWPEGHPNRDAAVEILDEKNPNEVDLPPASHCIAATSPVHPQAMIVVKPRASLLCHRISHSASAADCEPRPLGGTGEELSHDSGPVTHLAINVHFVWCPAAAVFIQEPPLPGLTGEELTRRSGGSRAALRHVRRGSD